MNQEMPTVEWPMPGYPFFPEDAVFAPQENLGRILANTFLQDLAAELDRRRSLLKTNPDKRDQAAYRHLTAAVAELRAADAALKIPPPAGNPDDKSNEQ